MRCYLLKTNLSCALSSSELVGFDGDFPSHLNWTDKEKKKKDNPKFLAARIRISGFHMPFPDGRIQMDDHCHLFLSGKIPQSARIGPKVMNTTPSELFIVNAALRNKHNCKCCGIQRPY